MSKKTLVMAILVTILLAMTALPALAFGFSPGHPVHGPGDLTSNPFKAPGHPEGCQAPLTLNENGQCALPGMHTSPDPHPHRRGF